MTDAPAAGSPVLFYFDFSSPYAYLVSQAVDEVCARHDRMVDWRPILLGVVMQHTRSESPVIQPLKRDYTQRDLARGARARAMPLAFPDPFPFLSVTAARAFYWIKDREEDSARAFGRRLFLETFGHGRSITSAEAVHDAARACGIDTGGLDAALDGQEVKQRLRREVEGALEAGVCGAPYFIADSEPFWGADRLDHLERWLETGGW